MPTTYFTHGRGNVDEFMSSAISEYNPTLTDTIYTGIPLLRYMNGKGRVKDAHGYSYVAPVRYAKNSTSAFITPSGTVNVSPQDNATSVQFRYRTLSASVVLLDDEADITDEYKVYDLFESKMEDSKLACMDTMSVAMMASPIAANSIESFATIIDSTGTIGDQSPTNNAWWASTETASGSMATQGLKDLTTLYNTVSKSLVDPPDLSVTTQTVYENYEAVMRGFARFDVMRDGAVDPGVAKGGLKFKGTTCFWDENATSGTWYMANLNYVHLRRFPNADFKVGQFVRPANQLLKVALIRWKGAMVCLNRARQGKLTGITA